MTDDIYRKQLEEFGIESVRVTKGDLEKKQKEDNRQSMLLVVKALMERMEGRQWIFSKLDMCKVFTAPFVPGHPDGTAFLCGIQSVGQNILDDVMQAAPNEFQNMMTEASARKLG